MQTLELAPIESSAAAEMERVVGDLGRLLREVHDKELVRRAYTSNPSAVLVAAAGLGYLSGGGLFTSFTRRILRLGTKAIVVFVAVSRVQTLENATQRER